MLFFFPIFFLLLEAVISELDFSKTTPGHQLWHHNAHSHLRSLHLAKSHTDTVTRNKHVCGGTRSLFSHHCCFLYPKSSAPSGKMQASHWKPAKHLQLHSARHVTIC